MWFDDSPLKRVGGRRKATQPPRERPSITSHSVIAGFAKRASDVSVPQVQPDPTLIAQTRRPRGSPLGACEYQVVIPQNRNDEAMTTSKSISVKPARGRSAKPPSAAARRRRLASPAILLKHQTSEQRNLQRKPQAPPLHQCETPPQSHPIPGPGSHWVTVEVQNMR